jgi:AcrR family transcriptional regulator
MSKGEETRRAIVEQAVAMASRDGLAGVSIGRLADQLAMSKSGLFAHFKSKEELQDQVLQAVSERFIDRVVRPGLKAPRGAPRLRALAEGWLRWGTADAYPGGCPIFAAIAELDDAPDDRVRQRLVGMMRDWIDVLVTTCRQAIEAGHFRRDVDPVQWAHDLQGVQYAFYVARRLLRDPGAEKRWRRSLDALFERSSGDPQRQARA